MHLRVLSGGLAAQAVAPSEQQHQLDRVWAAVDALKSAAKSLERLHEMDASRAIEHFERTLADESRTAEQPHRHKS
jgi:hypothetical protein